MQTYAKHRPTSYDPAGAFLDDDRQSWLVVPVMQTRDSGPFDLSNFAAALEMLGGESETVEVHRFGHWGPGWYEIIIIEPSSPQAAIAEEIERRLQDYPLLDEDDCSRREWNDYEKSWDQWAASDFRRELIKEFGLECKPAESCLDDCDNDTLREFYELLTPSGEFYICESSGVSIRVSHAVERCTRSDLAKFLRSIRH